MSNGIDNPSLSCVDQALVIGAQEARCTRRTTEKQISPKFICYATVVVRQDPERECDKVVTETYLLPHTTGRSFDRYLLLSNEDLNVTDIRTSLRDSETVHTLKTVDNLPEIHVSTLANPNPGNITIRYIVRNGVGRVSKMSPCPPARLNHGVLLWIFEKWNQQIDVLPVKLQSAIDDLNIQDSVSNASFLNATTADIIAHNVDANFLASGFIRHVNRCPVELACARGGSITLIDRPKTDFFEAKKSVLIGVGSAVVVLSIICLILFIFNFRKTG